MDKWTELVTKSLSKPFDTSQVKWKPQVTTKGRDKQPIMRNGQQVAGCTAHIDARDVMNRLDGVVGVENWQDEYTVVGPKNVECQLTVLGVTKCDVGEIGEGSFADPLKSAYSDALKRAAIKFGIGRHLYAMEMQWLPYDGFKITQKPTTKPQTKTTATKPPPPDKASDNNGQDSRGAARPEGQTEREEFRPKVIKVPMVTKTQIKKLNTLGSKVYNSEWDDERKRLVEWITDQREDGPQVSSSKDLYRGEAARLIDGLEEKIKEAQGETNA